MSRNTATIQEQINGLAAHIKHIDGVIDRISRHLDESDKTAKPEPRYCPENIDCVLVNYEIDVANIQSALDTAIESMGTGGRRPDPVGLMKFAWAECEKLRAQLRLLARDIKGKAKE